MNARKHRLVSRSFVIGCVALAAGLVAACGDDEDSATKARAKPTTFAVTASANGNKKALEFPTTVKAGLVTLTLTNDDSVPRSAQIIRVEGDHTVDDVLKIVRSEEEGVKIPAWMQVGGGFGVVQPGVTATVTQVLTPGKWAIWDDEGGDEDKPPNSALGAKGEFTVTGEAVDAELPKVAAKVTAIDEGDGKDKEYGFEFEGLRAGKNQVRFENTGDELHHAIFFPMAKGATVDKVLEFFKSDGESGGPPPVNFEKGFGTAVIDAGTAQNISFEVTRGRYAVVCFIGDREGGEPHVVNGMLEELTVE